MALTIGATAWRQIVAELAQAGTLSSTDALVVALTVVAVDRGRECGPSSWRATVAIAPDSP